MKNKIISNKYILGFLIVFILFCIFIIWRFFFSSPYISVKGEIYKAETVEILKAELKKNDVFKIDDIDISEAISLQNDDLSFLFIKIKNPKVHAYLDTDKFYEIIDNWNEANELNNVTITNDGEKFKISYSGNINMISDDIINIFNLDSNNMFDINIINQIQIEDYMSPWSNSQYDIYKKYLSLIEEANNLLSWKGSYENGYSISIPIDSITFEKDAISIDNSFLASIIEDLENYYDNIGNEINFSSTEQGEIAVSGGTWGTLMNSEEELAFLQESLLDNESFSNRTPIMKQNYSDIGNTYIEISLTSQHLWVYIDGMLTMESDIVSGNVLKGNDTPTGIYFISEKVDGKYLKGANYKTWVNKWMRLTNSGIGLHDAYWRSSFGNNIYKTNGSHGCINLPKDFAYNLYDITYIGMPVIIY